MKLKVFHGLVNYGSQAGILAEYLRRNGIYARSIIQPDLYQRKADFNFQYGGNLFWKIWYHGIYSSLYKILCIFKYDIFHFYYGTSLLPYQLDLPIIKLLRKKIVHHYLGLDVELYSVNVQKYEGGNMESWGADEGKKHDFRIKKRLAFESKYSDYTIVCAPKYAQFVVNSEIIPLAVDSSLIRLTNISGSKKEEGGLRILHAPTDRKIKGTQYLIDAVNKLVNEGFKIELKICEGISHNKLLDEYNKCDFSVVSLLGGWYGQAGVEAMTFGKGIITYLNPEYMKLMSEEFSSNCPIITANKDTIYYVLKETILKKDIITWGLESRQFVEKFHDANLIAKRLIGIYNSLYSK